MKISLSAPPQLIPQEEFQVLLPEYWGADEENQNFRFAISLGE